MKTLLTLITVLSLSVLMLGCPAKEESTSAPQTDLKVELTDAKAEAGCGKCTFQMADVSGCELAVKAEENTYLVTGSDVDAHEAGLCSPDAQACTVTGKVEEGKLVASAFELEEAAATE